MRTPPSVSDYKVAKGDLKALEDAVKALMAEGWRPIGGVVPNTLNRMEVQYLQAMVKP